MAKQMRVGVKAAWISAGAIILAALVTALFSKSGGDSDNHIQQVKEQKVDSGSINNYSAGRDLTIQNNNYAAISDTTKHIIKGLQEIRNSKAENVKQKNVTSYKSKNEIINNAPNQGVQINEVKGDVYLDGKALLPDRKIQVDVVKKLLSKNINSLPLGIEIVGGESETSAAAKQIELILNKMGYKDLKRGFIGQRLNTVIDDNGIHTGSHNGLDTHEDFETFWIVVDKNQ